jgi:hypothetical protein
VVGVVDDELADRPDVAFDPVRRAGVGRDERELDVAVLGPGLRVERTISSGIRL